LPGLPRAEVSRRLKANPATAGIPVLLVPDDAEADGGACGRPPAPWRPAELVARVQGLVRLHRAEEQARAARREADEAQARLAALVECSEDAIISVDLQGNITSWNGAAERLYGYPAREVLGRPCSFLVPPDRRDEVEAVKGRLRQGEHVPPF